MSKDFVAGLLGLFLGGGYLYMALALPSSAVQDQMGPKLFPCIIGGLALLSGLVLLIRAKIVSPKDNTSFSFNFVRDRGVYLRILVTVVAGILYGMVLDKWGYILATAFFMLILTFLVSKKVVQNLVISILFPLATYLIFSNLLDLSLPRGILDEIFPYL